MLHQGKATTESTLLFQCFIISRVAQKFSVIIAKMPETADTYIKEFYSKMRLIILQFSHFKLGKFL